MFSPVQHVLRIRYELRIMPKLEDTHTHTQSAMILALKVSIFLPSLFLNALKELAYGIM